VISRRRAYIAIVGLAFLFTVHASGCTVLGYYAGNRIDQDRRKSVGADQLVKLLPGSRITLLLQDGTPRRGIYLGLEYVARVEYERRYARSRGATKVAGLPAIDDTISCHTTNGAGRSGLFQGFMPGALLLQPDSASAMISLCFEEFEALVGPEGEIRSNALFSFEHGGMLPSRVAVLLATGRDTARIETDRVASVQLAPGATYRVIGVLVGATADVLVLAYLAAQTLEQAVVQGANQVAARGCQLSSEVRTVRPRQLESGPPGGAPRAMAASQGPSSRRPGTPSVSLRLRPSLHP
jgi:hypothetical protein